jgi:predicted O-methyltransferase YrrM
MDFLAKDLEKYISNHSEEEMPVLASLNRETYLKVMIPRMLSGHIQGNILQTFAHMIKPKRILEIGTYTGYSAICLAQGLTDDGVLHTIDINAELEIIIKKYVQEADLEEKIKFHIGNAIDIVPTLDETFDLVFIDADKDNYSNYFELVLPKVQKGGFIIADNVLWSGKVLEKKQSKIDKDTQGIVEFNQKVHQDSRVFHTLFGVRDGLMVMMKK